MQEHFSAQDVLAAADNDNMAAVWKKSAACSVSNAIRAKGARIERQSC
jgi:hypothetical protein